MRRLNSEKEVITRELSALQEKYIQVEAKKNVATESVESLKLERETMAATSNELKVANNRLLQDKTNIENALQEEKRNTADAKQKLIEERKTAEARKVREEEKKQQRAVVSTSESALCAYCKESFIQSEGAQWRGRAMSSNPGFSALIPDLCSEPCYNVMVEKLTERSWFSRMLR